MIDEAKKKVENVWAKRGTRIVQVDLRGEQLGRPARLDLGGAGNVRHTLTVLLPRLNQKGDAAHMGKSVSHYRSVRPGQNMERGRVHRGGTATLAGSASASIHYRPESGAGRRWATGSVARSFPLPRGGVTAGVSGGGHPSAPDVTQVCRAAKTRLWQNSPPASLVFCF